jgi:hypothetical protein
MIVRIFNEDQYRLDDSLRPRLQELDHECVAAIEAGDEQRFRATYDQLLELIRSKGERLDDDELEPSDLMLPPPDITLEEARGEFTGEGLIPD